MRWALTVMYHLLGKGLNPSSVEALRRVARDEKFFEETHWVCPKTLILFPEGKFPFISKVSFQTNN